MNISIALILIGGIIALLVGAMHTPVQASDCRIPTLPTSSGYATPNGQIVLIPTPIGIVSWQVALASGIDSSRLTTAHYQYIARSQETMVAAGRAMKRQIVGHNVVTWAAKICQIQLSGPVPQWVFDEQKKTVDLYESLRP